MTTASVYVDTVRILIADDEPRTLDALDSTLRGSFPDAVIDRASTLADAGALAREAASQGRPYHVACLDVRFEKVPNPPNGDIYFTADRRRLLAALGERTVVINYSGQTDDPDVRKLVATLGDPNFPKPVLVPTSEMGTMMIKYARQSVYGRRISHELNRMMEASHGGPVGGVAAYGPGGGTRAVGSLLRDIKESWNDLDDDLQRRIKDVFDVREVNGELIVNL